MAAAVKLSDAPVRGDLTAPGRVDAAGGGAYTRSPSGRLPAQGAGTGVPTRPVSPAAALRVRRAPACRGA